MSKFKALIFDFDGVITDTEPVHMESWLAVLEPLGITFGEDEYRAHYQGLNDWDFLDALGHIHHHHFSKEDKNGLMEEKLSASMNLLEHSIPLLAGVKEFVDDARKKYLMAICSGAQRSEIAHILKHLKWLDFFNPIIAGDSVKKGKPDPEGYIRAIEGLAERSDDVILPGDILAIEDSPKGVEAAKRAGLKCLGVCTTYSREEISNADYVAQSLSEVDFI